jgi:hypothetical protein
MMDIANILAQTGGLKSIAQELGITEAQVASGAATLAPAILGGFKKQTQSQPGGASALGGLLERLGGGSLLDDVLSPRPTDSSRGNDVLGQIFGSKDVSRTVAENAASKSGLDPSLLKKMLPMLAMLIAGYFAKHRGTGAAPSAEAKGGGLGDLLGGLLGGQSRPGAQSGLGSLLDADGDGNPLDDILRMAGKVLR